MRNGPCACSLDVTCRRPWLKVCFVASRRSNNPFEIRGQRCLAPGDTPIRRQKVPIAQSLVLKLCHLPLSSPCIFLAANPPSVKFSPPSTDRCVRQDLWNQPVSQTPRCSWPNPQSDR